jgi:NitT/TauT family transport system substrate-binding protein
MVNPKFAAENPDAVKGFLRAFLRALKETVKDPVGAVETVMKRNELAKKPAELERLRMALGQNILTSEVKANGYGAVDDGRLGKSIDQIGMTYEFKHGKPNADAMFDESFLPPAANRKVQ